AAGLSTFARRSNIPFVGPTLSFLRSTRSHWGSSTSDGASRTSRAGVLAARTPSARTGVPGTRHSMHHRLMVVRNGSGRSGEVTVGVTADPNEESHETRACRLTFPRTPEQRRVPHD